MPPPATTEIRTVSHHPPPVAVHTDTGVKPAPVVAPVVQTNTVIVVVTNIVAAVPPVTDEKPTPPVALTAKEKARPRADSIKIAKAAKDFLLKAQQSEARRALASGAPVAAVSSSVRDSNPVFDTVAPAGSHF